MLRMVIAAMSLHAASLAHAQLDWEEPWTSDRGRIDALQPLANDAAEPSPPSGRRIRFFPRSSVPLNLRGFQSDDGSENIGLIDAPVNILIENAGQLGTVDISTDRLVIWARGGGVSDLAGGASLSAPDGRQPFEFYMEGNIVFRQADRVIYAERMYYNVERNEGVILDAELLTPIPGYQGLVRLKAEVLHQVDPFLIEGFNGAVTTSRMGVPRYWLQSGDFRYQTIPNQGGSEPPFQPRSNVLLTEGRKRVTSRNNRIYLNEFPVFYWPWMAADLDRPSFYLESIRVNNDRVFGTQVLTEWDLYQLLGWQNTPAGTNWTASVDYLSKRGVGVGTQFEYDRPAFLSIPGRTTGFLHAWGINDSGFDNLGERRRSLTPEETLRGRILGRHRQQMPEGFELTGELGYIRDRDFLEQYYEQEWDQEKDQTTGLELKRRVDNRSWSVSGDARLNDFFTQTQWLPRADHFWIGQPILGDWLSWTEHSSVGYAQLRVADAPQDANEQLFFDPLAWEANREGLRGTTRHRLDLPLNLGPGKVVPYAMGEAAYWQEDLNANDVSRLFGQLGVRGSLPFYRIDPTIQSTLFNLNGLAHKIVLESEVFWADANANFDTLPLYDPLDDDAQEAFRRRFFFDTFQGIAGGNVPLRFDERYYALRSGLQRSVTSPNPEIADDLFASRMAVRQRWQTKRGLPGQQRVVDWISLDTEGFFFPLADRDNFGQSLGLLSYDLRWHVGDRFTVLSDGQVDFFEEGLRTVSLGGMYSRPGLARYVAGIRSIEGPISSSILFGSTSYRLSPKWIINYGSTYDFGSTGNIGQRGEIVRVGESFLIGMGFNYDSSRDNFGVRFSIEPRFLSGRLSNVGGVPIPPVGVSGLE